MTASSLSSNPLGYTGINYTQNPPMILAQRAPTTNDIYNIGTRWTDESVSPFIIYVTIGNGTWNTEGANPATTSTYGTVLLTDNSQPVATKLYADNLAIAGSPVATTTVAGIGQLATDAEAIAGTPSTGLLALFVTPSNLAPVLAAGSIPGSFTDLTATGTVSFTGATGGITMTSATASSFGTTGAGIDLTLDSASGSVVLSAGEAIASAIGIQAAAGGVDIDGALLVSISSSRNNANAIELVASAGGIDISATGTAGEDIDILATGSSVNITATENVADSIVISSTNGGIDITAAGATAGEDIDILATGSSINLTSTENAALSIYLHANGGTSETIRLRADQGTGVDSIDLLSDVGGVTISAGVASADAINIVASDAAGGIDIDSGTGGFIVDTSGLVTVTSTANSASAIQLHANGGTSETILVRADQGTGVTSVALTSDVGGITLTAGLATADAINIVTSNAGGGIDIDAGTAGFIVDTTGGISLDSAAASNFTATGAFDITIQSTAGSVIVSASEDAADAVQILSTAGGIDILATGEAAQDIDIVNTGGSVNVTATENVAEAIYIRTNGGTSETLRLHADQGTGVASINIGSDVGGVTIAGGLGTADAVNITASTAGGGIDIDASTAGVIVDTTGAISLDSAAASNFTVTGAFDLTLNTTAGSVILTAGESAADSMVLTNNGMDIVTAGAAGRDIDMTNTGGSINITATENVSDAIIINASGAASGMTLDCGTASLTIGTGIKHAVTSTNTAATPYAVLGTDYFITTDTTGGAMTVTLPAVPGTGRTVVIYDGAGQAAAGGNVTIDGNGNNIAASGTSAATKLINTAYESYILTFNGTIWCGQNIV